MKIKFQNFTRKKTVNFAYFTPCFIDFSTKLVYRFLMQKICSDPKKSLSALSDSALHEHVVTASKNEKEATLVLLENLALADSRRLYAVMGYSSLWEYVHKALQYSEAQASERVNAVRLMRRTPEVKEELKNGALSLTSVSKLASHVRREKCDSRETLELLKEVVNKPTREVEKILAQESTEGPRLDQIKVITKTTTRITIEVENEFLELMNQVKELGGYEGMPAQEIFKTTMRDFVKRREMKEAVKKAAKVAVKVKDSSAQKNKLSTRAPEVKLTPEVQPTLSRYLSRAVRTKIRLRSKNQCEFISPNAKKRCESRTKLEFDHIKPHAANGPNTEENIRHYCATHNRLSAIQFFGVEKMKEYLKN